MQLAQLSDAQIMRIVTPIMDDLMDASTAIDYVRHIQNFTERARHALPKHRFDAICVEYQRARGFFGARELVAIFRRPQSAAIVWKQAFTRQPGEFVAELVLVQVDDRYLVDHVMVF